jgi:hypothetical protein
MSKYRKVDVKVWNDMKFNFMSERGKLIFLFLMTHPNLTMLGAMRATVPGLAAEIHIPLDGFQEAFQKVTQKGMAKYDETSCLIWLPNFLKYNRPESANVVRSWPKAYDLIPESVLKVEIIQRAKGFIQDLSEPFQKAFAEAFPEALPEGIPEGISKALPEVFPEALAEDLPKALPEALPEDLPKGLPEAFPKTSPNQEQEQEQEQEKDTLPGGRESEQVPTTDEAEELALTKEIALVKKPVDFEETWNRLRGPLPEIREFTKSRRQKVKCRMTQGVTVEAFARAVMRCANTPFLRGENRNGWKVSFDWLVENDTNLVRVMEGRYDPAGESSKQPRITLDGVRSHDGEYPEIPEEEAERIRLRIEYREWLGKPETYRKSYPWKRQVPDLTPCVA